MGAIDHVVGGAIAARVVRLADRFFQCFSGRKPAVRLHSERNDRRDVEFSSQLRDANGLVDIVHGNGRDHVRPSFNKCCDLWSVIICGLLCGHDERRIIAVAARSDGAIDDAVCRICLMRGADIMQHFNGLPVDSIEGFRTVTEKVAPILTCAPSRCVENDASTIFLGDTNIFKKIVFDRLFSLYGPHQIEGGKIWQVKTFQE